MDKVVHFEIPADSIERARKFYGTVFGWQITKSQMPGDEYWLVNTVETDDKGMPKTPGAINGGMTKKRKETGPVIVIKVASIEDALKKAKKEGAQIVLETFPVGNIGLYARIKDTEGNIVGVWQDANV